MRSIIRALAPLLLLGSVMLVSSCGKPPLVVTKPVFPRSADVQAAVTPEPVPSPNIATDETAYVNHQKDVEIWGQGIWRAAGRMCRQMVRLGAPFDFCPPAPAGSKDDQ